MASGATRTFAASLDHAGDIARRFFAPLAPCFPTISPSQHLTIEFALTPAQRQRPITILTAVLDGYRAARGHPRPARGVVLDEFHEIILEGGDRAAHELRATVASHRYTGYAFASSHLRLMDELMNGAYLLPLRDLADVRVLGAISTSTISGRSSRGGLASAGAPTGGQAEDAAIEEILDLAEDVPRNVQWLCSGCWDDLQLGRTLSLTSSPPAPRSIGSWAEHYSHYMLVWANSHQRATAHPQSDRARTLRGFPPHGRSPPQRAWRRPQCNARSPRSKTAASFGMRRRTPALSEACNGDWATRSSHTGSHARRQHLQATA